MNVISELRALGLDDNEAVLSVAAASEAGGRHRTGPRSFALLKGGDTIASVELNAKYAVKNFAVPEDLWPGVKKKISEAMSRTKAVVARTTLLSHRELTSYARVERWMQMRPLGYPVSDRTGLHMGPVRVPGGPPVPFSLEVFADVVDLPFLDAYRRIRAVDEATWLLSTFIATPIFRPRAPYAFAVLEDGIATVRCGTPGLEGELPDDRFADVSAFPALCPVAYDKYYEELGIASPEFEIPDVSALYSMYRYLPAVDRQRFLRACATVFEASGPELGRVQRLVALVGAIEPLLEEGKRCPKCGNHTGITENFRAFVDTHVKPPDEIRKLYHDVYVARSELAHGAWHYDVDEPTFGITLKSEPVSLAAWAIAKRGIVSWLRSRYCVYGTAQ